MAADATGRRNGRGAYLCRQALCWEKGLTKRVLERRLSVAVSSRNLAELQQYFIATFASAAAAGPSGAAAGDAAAAPTGRP